MKRIRLLPQRLRPFKLRWQFMLSYLPLLVTPILVMTLVTRTVTENGLVVLITREAQQRAVMMVRSYADYYTRFGTWDGVHILFGVSPPLRGGNEPLVVQPVNSGGQPVSGQGTSGQGVNTQNRQPGNRQIGQPIAPPNAPGQPPPGLDVPPIAGEHTIITDLDGKVVASNDARLIGQTVTAEILGRGVDIYVNHQSIGKLIYGTSSTLIAQAQESLLASVNAGLLISGGISALLMLGLGFWLSRQITAPVRQLMRGVRGLSSGKWSAPLPITAHNELGDLTASFNQMAGEITHQEQLRRQMVADIAHDLRTPLSILALEIEGIKEGMQSPGEAATSLQEETEWLQHLVDDLHTLSLMDAHQMTLHRQPLDVAPLLRSVYNHWQTVAAREQRQISLDVPDQLPPALVDSHRMRQVLGNLINNAVQHTPPDAHITLNALVSSGRTGDSSGQTVEINVCDDGEGIPAEALPHIFDRFYRADKSRHHARTRKTRNSGLGLSIAAQLVALHGGTLTVQSQVGVGSIFTVRLPVTHEASVDDSSPDRDIPPLLPTHAKIRSKAVYGE